MTALSSAASQHKRFYRLRIPATGMAVSVRVDPVTDQLYAAVGPGRRRMFLTIEEAWTLWRCLSEAVASLGEPPEHVRAFLNPTGSRKGRRA